MPEKAAPGGPAACEPPFNAELRRLGHEVVEEVYAYAEANSGLGRINRVLGTARRFQECLRDGHFDLVHINTSFDNTALMRDAVIVPRLSGLGPKIFLKFHGSDARLLAARNPIWVNLRRRLLSKVDGIGVLSTEEQQNFLRAGVEQKTFVVNNVVEKNAQPRHPEFLRRWSLPGNRPLLLFIGRFVPTKGLLDVIAACGVLRDCGEQFFLLCLGDGPARSEAERLVAQLNLQTRVRFFGYIPEEQTAGFYANSDVLLFPTYHTEGFPMVIFNAAAAGLPIITTRIRAAADYLQEPENCLWVEPRRPDMLADRITELLKSPQLRLSMAGNNTKLAARFSAELVTAEYLKVYQQIMKATGPH